MRCKVKCTLVQALRFCTGRTAHRGSTVIALLFLDRGTRRGWGISVTLRPLFTPGKDSLPIVQEAGWAPGPVWTVAENLAPTGIRFPDRPARCQSLYLTTLPGVLWDVQAINRGSISYVGKIFLFSQAPVAIRGPISLVFKWYKVLYFRAQSGRSVKPLTSTILVMYNAVIPRPHIASRLAQRQNLFTYLQNCKTPIRRKVICSCL